MSRCGWARPRARRARCRSTRRPFRWAVELCDEPNIARMPTSAAPAEMMNGINHSSTGIPAICASITTIRSRSRRTRRGDGTRTRSCRVARSTAVAHARLCGASAGCVGCHRRFVSFPRRAVEHRHDSALILEWVVAAELTQGRRRDRHRHRLPRSPAARDNAPNRGRDPQPHRREGLGARGARASCRPRDAM
jgi:hypothetical protein